MEEVSALLGRMLTKARQQTPPNQSVEITLTARQLYQICDKYSITPLQLMEAIKQYCFDNDINLERFEEERAQAMIKKKLIILNPYGSHYYSL